MLGADRLVAQTVPRYRPLAGDQSAGCPAPAGLRYRYRLSNDRRERFEHLVVLRESPDFVFAEDHLPVRLDVEDTTSARDQLGIDVIRILDCGRQTGGLREVVSLLAIRNADLHEALLRLGQAVFGPWRHLGSATDRITRAVVYGMRGRWHRQLVTGSLPGPLARLRAGVKLVGR